MKRSQLQYVLGTWKMYISKIYWWTICHFLRTWAAKMIPLITECFKKVNLSTAIPKKIQEFQHIVLGTSRFVLWVGIKQLDDSRKLIFSEGSKGFKPRINAWCMDFMKRQRKVRFKVSPFKFVLWKYCLKHMESGSLFTNLYNNYWLIEWLIVSLID